MSSAPPLVLAFAASDPTGGAGVQADVLTLAALGCHPLSVVTALTVQDTHGVDGVLDVETQWVDAQARRLLDDMRVSAFKLGVLGSPQNIAAVARILAVQRGASIVVDPVLASARGDSLSSDASVKALCELVLPLATVVTPNSVEARRLAGDGDLAQCARQLVRMGARYVLITGTHEADAEVVNTLYDAGGTVRVDRWPRLPGSYHGSGCTLASAIAARLAWGDAVPEAVRAAQLFTWQALAGGFRPGAGQYLPNRFHR
jgi:hydroxymethylpyrimidine/phosphomethylpyrimidine kinase